MFNGEWYKRLLPLSHPLVSVVSRTQPPVQRDIEMFGGVDEEDGA
jgi:hypothetical protein